MVGYLQSWYKNDERLSLVRAVPVILHVLIYLSIDLQIIPATSCRLLQFGSTKSTDFKEKDYGWLASCNEGWGILKFECNDTLGIIRAFTGDTQVGKITIWDKRVVIHLLSYSSINI